MTATNSDLRAGIDTREQFDEDPYGYKVEWIKWDSDFRNTDLRPGDTILGINDILYQKEFRQQEMSRAMGGPMEPAHWQEQGAGDGHTINLNVWRDGQTLNISGKIHSHRFYYDAHQKPALGPNGPNRISNDGFNSPWMSWYEQFVKKASIILSDPLWERSRINNLKLLEEHNAEKVRVDFLTEKFPGPFAESVLSDWHRMYEVLEGKTYNDITEQTLEYRKIGEQRMSIVKEAALKARKAFTIEMSERLIPPFPAKDPIMDDVASVAGKVVELPYIPIRQIINDLGKSYAVIGSQREGYYIIHMKDSEIDMFFGTLFRYQAQVTPDVSERYQFFGEIINEPTMVTYDRRPITGLMLKVIAGAAGNDNFFVDLRKPDAKNEVRFSGEELIATFGDFPLDHYSPPDQVMRGLIHYIKYADKARWKNLFSTWRIFTRWSGPPVIDTAYILPDSSFHSIWEQSRKQIVNDIYDVRVIYTGPVMTVIEPDKDQGIPHVEQVKVILDHIGLIGDRYRSVSNINVHRKWILQRMNGGPWKIVEPQAL